MILHWAAVNISLLNTPISPLLHAWPVPLCYIVLNKIWLVFMLISQYETFVFRFRQLIMSWLKPSGTETWIITDNQAPLLLTWLTFIPAWISNYIYYKVWDEINHPFLNFNSSTHPCLDSSYTMLVKEAAGLDHNFSRRAIEGAALPWRHDRRGSVSNHQPNDCLLNHSFRRRSKKT